MRESEPQERVRGKENGTPGRRNNVSRGAEKGSDALCVHGYKTFGVGGV